MFGDPLDIFPGPHESLRVIVFKLKITNDKDLQQLLARRERQGPRRVVAWIRGSRTGMNRPRCLGTLGSPVQEAFMGIPEALPLTSAGLGRRISGVKLGVRASLVILRNIANGGM